MKNYQLTINAMSTQELERAETITKELLLMLQDSILRTNQKLINNDLYIHLHLFNRLVNNELLWRKVLG